MLTLFKSRTSAAARQAAFEAEILPHIDALHRTALRLTRHAARADDLVQDALLKAWRFFDSFEAGTNARAWVFRVLYTTFVSSTRTTEPPLAAIDDVPEVADEGRLIDELNRESAAERERAVLEAVDDRVKAAIDALPDDLRMVFMLATVEGLKYREIAVVMDSPLGTVMSRLFRGRRLLQDSLASYAKAAGYQTGAAAPRREP